MISAGPRVFDCFTFKDELDLLDLRLRMLAPVVDFFIIVEATETFSGEPKELCFARNVDRYAEFRAQIIHVVVDDLPAIESRWLRERYQRNAIRRGLGDARDDDLLLIGDVDEIPAPEVVTELREELTEPSVLEMQLFYYKYNLSGGSWDLARAIRFGHSDCFDCLRRTTGLPVVRDAGWHLSYILDASEAIRKIGHFSHTELDRFATNPHLERCIRLQLDGSRGHHLRVVPDEELPTEIRALRTSQPHLFASPLGAAGRLEQAIYGLTVTSRWHADPRDADQHPYRTALRVLPHRVKAKVRG